MDVEIIRVRDNTVENERKRGGIFCGICHKKFKENDKVRTFENDIIDKVGNDNNIFEVKRFHTINNEFFIRICEDCFNPPIHKEG